MIINTSVKYNSTIFKSDIMSLVLHFPFLKLFTIGYSVLEKPIYCIRLGTGSKRVFYCATFHANEWITTTVFMKFIEDMCIAYNRNSSFLGYNIRSLLNKVSFYIVPMVNPDGVDLINNNINLNSNAYRYAKYIANSYPNVAFSNGWKANIEGIDLNLQFPANWEKARQIKFSQGITSPAPRDFVGDFPLQAPEALAIYNFTNANNFDLVLAYHTQGKEIYWQFENYAPKGSFEIAKKFENVSGYSLADVPYASSFAGFKDFFIQKYQRPGFTIEAGLGENPLSLPQFNQIYKDNIGILVLGGALI